MQYVRHDLGQRKRGELVRVTLKGNAANVRLMNSSAFSSYKAGRRYRFTGGYAKRSPVTLAIPSSGHWYVVVDLGGLPGRIRSSAEVLPGAAPPIREASFSTPAIRHASGEPAAESLRVEPPTLGKFDVFICHASEDKDSLVRALAKELVDLGLVVFYDEYVMTMGSSIRRTIDHGLANSRFGVVVLSHAFFAKEVPQRELDGLVTRESTGEQIILPIWHNISKDEVIKYSPTLADKIAARTADSTIHEIAVEIAERVRPPEDTSEDADVQPLQVTAEREE
jgi:hypothetical protein